MRIRIAATLAVLACLATATAASARLSWNAAAWARAPITTFDGIPANTTLTAKNAEFIENFPQHSDSSGARLVGHYFYITTERDLTIYDTSAPEAPKQVGYLQFPATDLQGYYYPQEDPDTNGKILLTTNEGAVEVIDVSDKANPKFLSKLAGKKQHTISCLLDCTWAYGSCGSLSCKTGEIIDLRDPEHPKSDGDWVTEVNKQLPAAEQPNSNHDVTEVSPGMVLTSSTPMLLLDAREDPAHPKVLAEGGHKGDPFVHANLWPHQMTDDKILVGGESEGPSCDSDAAASFKVFDAANWQTTGRFDLLHEFKLPYGQLVDGSMPNSTWCVHWFTPHPTYHNGGLIAISWYEQGTRFLQVGPDGTVTQVGWLLPAGATASGAYWITDRIVYVADYNRGLDVIRYTGPITGGDAS